MSYFVFFCFIGFSKWRKQLIILTKRKGAKTQRFILNTENTKGTKAFVYSVSSVFMFILTTDIQDCRDIHHERKRDNPFNLCYLCSFK